MRVDNCDDQIEQIQNMTGPYGIFNTDEMRKPDLKIIGDGFVQLNLRFEKASDQWEDYMESFGISNKVSGFTYVDKSNSNNTGSNDFGTTIAEGKVVEQNNQISE